MKAVKKQKVESRAAGTAKKKATRAPEDASTPGKTARSASGDEAARPLVLVVDDYGDAREMCCEILEFGGYRTVGAKDGLEAIARAKEMLPSLILMDLSIPGIDGWEATRRLKSDPATKKIPIIALTGHALAGHEEGAKKAGCDGFLTKPCLPDDLIAAVNRMTGRPATRKKGT